AKNKQSNRIYSKTAMGKALFALKAYQTSDKKKGFATDISKQDVLNARLDLCFYCGFPATGLDRIDNTKGHTKNNCVPACKDCNVARMDNFSFEEIKMIGNTIRMIKLKREKVLFGLCVM